MTSERVRTASLVLVLGLAAFAVIYVVSHGLFVFTEARQSLLSPFPRVEAQRYFLFPILNWGAGRLSGAASFQLTGALCGPDADCVNGVGAVLVAVAVVVLVLHTFQLVRSRASTALVAVLWCLSPAVLGITLWQAARYDLLAFMLTLSCGAFWWAALGRVTLSWAARIGFVAGSVLLLAASFNGKELTYYLPAILIVLAVLRAPRAGIGRNLLLTVVPLAYSAWYIAWAVTHMHPDYAAYVSESSVLDTIPSLLTAMLGMERSYMYLWQGGLPFDELAYVAALGYCLALALFAVLAFAAWGASRRSRTSGGAAAGAAPWPADGPASTMLQADGSLSVSGTTAALAWLRAHAAEVYLALTFLFTLVIGSRSIGATAYYMTIPYWALLVLVVLVARRIAGALPHQRLVLAVLLVAVSAPALVGCAAQLSSTSAWRQLMTASEHLADLGAELRRYLADRPVSAVAWRALEEPQTGFYVTRFTSEGQGGAFIWPFLMGERVPLPTFTTLTEGTTDELARDAAGYASPGEVLLVISADYDLQLLTYEGQVLYQAPQVVSPSP